MTVDRALARELFAESKAARWGLSLEAFSSALAASIDRAFPEGAPAGAIDRYARGLHLEDLALACACATGHDAAWQHFILEHRPALYRAADAIDPTGGAREIADALYADLYTSLFRYFHGRSRLSTWLRAVLAQRHVDRIRATRRLEPLPDDDAGIRGTEARAAVAVQDPDRGRFVTAMRAALVKVLASLPTRDRLRLSSYYVQDLTLAAIGRLLHEHEGTVSRHLTRTRRDIRNHVAQRLKDDHGMDDATVTECFESIVDDPGALDIGKLVGAVTDRKIDARDRSH